MLVNAEVGKRKNKETRRIIYEVHDLSYIDRVRDHAEERRIMICDNNADTTVIRTAMQTKISTPTNMYVVIVGQDVD